MSGVSFTTNTNTIVGSTDQTLLTRFSNQYTQIHLVNNLNGAKIKHIETIDNYSQKYKEQNLSNIIYLIFIYISNTLSGLIHE